MRYIILFLLAILALAACQKTPEPAYFQPVNSTAIIDDYEKIAIPAKVCNVSGSEYIILEPFIYVRSEQNASLVMTWVGTYKHDKVKGNWNLLPFLNKKDNVYWDSLSWIEAGKLGSGEDITCTTAYTIPKIFSKFYKSYKPLYNKADKPEANATEGM